MTPSPPDEPGFLKHFRVSDERREILRVLLGRLEVRSWRRGVQALVVTLVAAAVAYGPTHAGLSEPGRHALFILTTSAGLWMTEAIPAFAVALVLIAMEIVLLGGLGREPATSGAWQRFLAPWASPLIWLFLGGFVLGRAASKTGLDRFFATRVLRVAGPTPAASLFGLMFVGFVLSMFMSNTAAAAMLLAVVTPVAASLPKGDPFRRGLMLGVPVAANLGGMGTLIGSPPNAIAVGALPPGTVDFARWMLLGIPPALVLLVLAWWDISRRYPCSVEKLDLGALDRPPTERLPAWRQGLVLVVFVVTLGAWLTTSIHGIPTPVVSFLPISVFAATGVLRPAEVRELGWDILLLLAGGLALGLAVSETGLAAWMVERLPISALGRFSLAVAVAYIAAILSNVMSNTAAATILMPLGVALGVGFEQLVAVPIALAASAAMCLPISTPPNAIAFSSGELESRDLLRIGLLMGVAAPLLAVAWCAALFR